MKKFRAIGTVSILIITVVLIGRYVVANPDTLTQLAQINPLYIVLIIILYSAVLFSLTVVNTLSVHLSNKKINFRESLALTSTSSIANFFGPLQSGVGIRAVYFKTKLGISIKRYLTVSLYYYAFYAFISGVFLLFGSPQWRLPVFALLLIGSTGTTWYIRRQTSKLHGGFLQPQLLLRLAVITLIQLVCTTAVYGIELLSLGKTFHLSQLISYSGAANFSVFVAITPGAIGIREAFLVFSENLHHLSRDTIISANILDRGVYVVFLSIVFGGLLVTHTQRRLKDFMNKSTDSHHN